MRSVLVLVAGTFMIVSAFSHGALGWPTMRAELEKAGAPENLIGGLAAGWLFGSAAMAAFGVITVLSALRLRRQDLSGILFLRVIAACYAFFGLVAFVARSFNPFFLVFVATGLLAGLPVAGIRRQAAVGPGGPGAEVPRG